MPAPYFPGKGPRAVNRCGAAAGSILLGSGLNNQGLRLRVVREQAPGDGGPIKGDFVILRTGDNVHAWSLHHLLYRVTNAEEVARVIRRQHRSCVNVVNANILSPEPGDAEGAAGQGRE